MVCDYGCNVISYRLALARYLGFHYLSVMVCNYGCNISYSLALARYLGFHYLFLLWCVIMVVI